MLGSSSSSSSSTTENTDFDYLERVRDGIAEAGLQRRLGGRRRVLVQRRFHRPPEAEDSLAKAWNWRSWAVVKSPMARKFIKPIKPDVEQIRAAVQWLREGPLAVPDAVLVTGVREHPAVYLLAPQVTYEQALSVAPEPYSSPNVFRETLLRSPSVLGCTFNCVDQGCNSECGSCWVSFQTVNKQIKGE